MVQISSSREPAQNPLYSKRVAVTGATGFLGGYVVEQLRAAGATVLGIVDEQRANSRHDYLDALNEIFWFPHVEHMVPAIRSAEPDYVIHLHAVVTTERSPATVQSTLKTNVLPSVELMLACMETKVKRLILMGSGEEFGPVTGPFDDCTIADPPSPYGASKAAVTGYAKMFNRSFDLPVVILRPSVVYGPKQSPRMLIPQVMHALANNCPIDVTEGRQTRDFIFVKDVAAGIAAALTAPGIDGRSYNLASGEIVTVRECLALIEQISGRNGLIRYGAKPYKTGEVFSYEPVSERTYTSLNWRPSTRLKDGLAVTWKSFTESVTSSNKCADTLA